VGNTSNAEILTDISVQMNTQSQVYIKLIQRNLSDAKRKGYHSRTTGEFMRTNNTQSLLFTSQYGFFGLARNI
jgi:hypothetical protein